MIKADLHVHTKEDDFDTGLKYGWKEVIDRAAVQEYNALAITWHDNTKDSKEISDYAKQKEIVLIPACEKTIEGKHVLLYNFTKAQLARITNFEELRREKKQNNLIIAPHPYFPFGKALKEKLIKNIDVFDAIEYSQCYTSTLNFNKKAVKTAIKYGKPLVANSDCHTLWYLDSINYTIINAPKNIEKIINAIKKGKTRIETKPLTHKQLAKFLWWVLRM